MERGVKLKPLKKRKKPKALKRPRQVAQCQECNRLITLSTRTRRRHEGHKLTVWDTKPGFTSVYYPITENDETYWLKREGNT